MQKKIILASQSPRRKELLHQLGFRFESIALDIDETYPAVLIEEQIPTYLVQKKALAFGTIEQNTLLLTADTIVWNQGKVMEKPNNTEEAISMLLELSGNEHYVYSAVGFNSTDFSYTLWDKTKVCFDTISFEEAQYYVEEFTPLDKAGAYGIQDWIGMAKVKSMVGSYYNVMGLPTQKVYHELQKIMG